MRVNGVIWPKGKGYGQSSEENINDKPMIWVELSLQLFDDLYLGI
jgi:hypothetical protein